MKEYLVCYDDKMQGANFSDRLDFDEVAKFIKDNDADKHWHGYYIVKIVEDKF